VRLVLGGRLPKLAAFLGVSESSVTLLRARLVSDARFVAGLPRAKALECQLSVRRLS
jgi:hypothetical protein